MLCFPLWPVFPSEMHANFFTPVYACGPFPIPMFLRDSDEAPVGGKLNAIHAVGGAARRVQRWRGKATAGQAVLIWRYEIN